jgi:hypothetical protein
MLTLANQWQNCRSEVKALTREAWPRGGLPRQLEGQMAGLKIGCCRTQFSRQDVVIKRSKIKLYKPKCIYDGDKIAALYIQKYSGRQKHDSNTKK